jgi:hypothetical protein
VQPLIFSHNGQKWQVRKNSQIFFSLLTRCGGAEAFPLFGRADRESEEVKKVSRSIRDGPAVGPTFSLTRMSVQHGPS